MALNAGDTKATSGLSGAIYTALSAAVQAQGVTPTAAMQTSWQGLSYAIASSVVAELTGPTPTGAEFAETFSTSAQDPFWLWLAGFINVFMKGWAPTTSDGLALQNALKTFLATTFGTPPNTVTGVPTQLAGRLR